MKIILHTIRHVWETLFVDRTPPTPWLRRDLNRDFEYEGLDADIQLFMMGGYATDPINARRMIDQYGGGNVVTALMNMPDRPRMNMTARLRWLRVWFLGGYYRPPLEIELEQLQDGTLYNPPIRGMTWVGTGALKESDRDWQELPVRKRKAPRVYKLSQRR